MITTKGQKVKKPVMKSNRVQVSGYILMKDPKDQAKIDDLKHKISIMGVDLAQAKREVKQLRQQVNALRPLGWVKNEAAGLLEDLNRFGNRKIKDFIYDWPDANSSLVKFAKKTIAENK